jgi:hypothetical protein
MTTNASRSVRTPFTVSSARGCADVLYLCSCVKIGTHYRTTARDSCLPVPVGQKLGKNARDEFVVDMGLLRHGPSRGER